MPHDLPSLVRQIFTRLALANPRRVVALTGAGISTDSGIPDVRGPQGVWTTNPAAQALSTLQAYLADALLRGPIGQVLPALCSASRQGE